MVTVKASGRGGGVVLFTRHVENGLIDAQVIVGRIGDEIDDALMRAKSAETTAWLTNLATLNDTLLGRLLVLRRDVESHDRAMASHDCGAVCRMGDRSEPSVLQLRNAALALRSA